MKDFSISEVFSQLLQDEDFKSKYFYGYLDRFVYSSTDLKNDLGESTRQAAIVNLLDAFKYVIDNEEEYLTPQDLISIGNIVNKGRYIGLRKVNVSAGEYANWDPVPKEQLYFHLYSLFDNYYNGWKDLDVYEREAYFHIMLMRIHPFEDGNKRTAKILLNANLVKNNHPPVVISKGETQIYYDFINNMDFEGFANFIKEKSLQELGTLISYYKVVNDIPIVDSVVENINNKGSR